MRTGLLPFSYRKKEIKKQSVIIPLSLFYKINFQPRPNSKHCRGQLKCGLLAQICVDKVKTFWKWKTRREN